MNDEKKESITLKDYILNPEKSQFIKKSKIRPNKGSILEIVA
jgi:hypothetical protein